MELQQSQEIEKITTEILIFKQQTAVNIIEIGRRLIQAKEMLPHGEWGKWLEEEVDFSDRTARRFMQVVSEFSKRPALADLPPSKVFALLEVFAEEREQFVQQPQIIPSTGETKTVNEMSTRELKEAIKARKEAEKLATDARSEINRLAEDNTTLRQANKELAIAKKQETVEKIVEKEVLPQGTKEQLDKLQKENLELRKKESELKSHLSSEEYEIDKLKKEREKLEHKTYISIYELQLITQEYLKKASPYLFMQGIKVSDLPISRNDLLDTIEALEEFARKLREVINGENKIINVRDLEVV